MTVRIEGRRTKNTETGEVKTSVSVGCALMVAIATINAVLLYALFSVFASLPTWAKAGGVFLFFLISFRTYQWFGFALRKKPEDGNLKKPCDIEIDTHDVNVSVSRNLVTSEGVTRNLELTSVVKQDVNSKGIVDTLATFGINVKLAKVVDAPQVTQYQFILLNSKAVSEILKRVQDLELGLGVEGIAINSPVDGKPLIGIDIPKQITTVVTFEECINTDEFRNAPSKLTFVLGKAVSGGFKYADLTKMPHLLIGGSTNSGKSICLNVIIASLIYRATPREVRLMMIDPKRVELSLWAGIPHLMRPIVRDVSLASEVFEEAIREMDRRYVLFAEVGTRNIDGYNQRMNEDEKLPYIVLVVDELADLMMSQRDEVETSICRLAQLARATGIHLVIATQRPSVDIITGTIKANISSRIAFAVASQVDSRTILDCVGADRLIGRGDMLYMPIDAPKPTRIQGAYLGENETNRLVEQQIALE